MIRCFKDRDPANVYLSDRCRHCRKLQCLRGWCPSPEHLIAARLRPNVCEGTPYDAGDMSWTWTRDGLPEGVVHFSPTDLVTQSDILSGTAHAPVTYTKNPRLRPEIFHSGVGLGIWALDQQEVMAALRRVLLRVKAGKKRRRQTVSR
jgi:hypothetical protein